MERAYSSAARRRWTRNQFAFVHDADISHTRSISDSCAGHENRGVLLKRRIRFSTSRWPSGSRLRSARPEKAPGTVHQSLRNAEPLAHAAGITPARRLPCFVNSTSASSSSVRLLISAGATPCSSRQNAGNHGRSSSRKKPARPEADRFSPQARLPSPTFSPHPASPAVGARNRLAV